MTAKRAKTSTTSRKAKSAPATAVRAKTARPAKTAAKAGPKKSAPRAAKTAAKAAPRPAARPTLRDIVLDALADMKAVDVKALDVRGITDVTDTMVVASGNSDRHVKSIADRVLQRCKEAGFRPYGMEGERDGEWVLVDLNDLVLHVMLPRTRQFYALEKLWESGGAHA
jgi:ribosome silencing factor RsfS/YbeB/iojap